MVPRCVIREKDFMHSSFTPPSCGILGAMRIMLILTLYEPYARGGAERVVALLARGLASRGHDVHVVTTAPWRQVQWSTSAVQHVGVMVHRIFHGSLFFHGDARARSVVARVVRLCAGLCNVFFAWRVYHLVRAVQPDVVHTHNLFGSSFLIPFVLRRLRVRHVHTLHDIQLLIPSGRLLIGEESHWINRGCLTRWYGDVQLWLWGSPHVVTAPSQWLLTYHRSRNFFVRSTLRVIHHVFLTAERPVSTLALKLNEERESFTILYAGQIERAKGVLMLIRLFSEYCAAHPDDDAELMIIGTGTDLETARTLASACVRIHLIGELSHERVATCMAVADVIVVPSLLYENAPQVIVEALAAHRPVSVSDVGGAAELVRAQNAGWVVAPHEQAWRQHIAWLMDHRDEVVVRRPSLPNESSVGIFEQLYANAYHHHAPEC